MPANLKLFATGAFPLHPSGMRLLQVCPWRAAMKFLNDVGDGEGGPAADTGSAMHMAAASFHRGHGVAESIGVMQAMLNKYPQADLNDAAMMFLSYAADPRNKEAKTVLVEESIAFTLAPAAEDETQAPIEVIGTVDQVREINGQYYVYDIKTSKKEPSTIAYNSTFQVAAYCVGASIRLNKPVQGARLILPRRYAKREPKDAPVFWHYSWTWDDLPQILAGLRHQVAAIRAGRLYHMPNSDCDYCHAKSPDLCLPALQTHLRLRNADTSAPA